MAFLDPSAVVCGGGDPGRKTSRLLEKQLKRWHEEYTKTIKILLLGAGEAGKTTIIKQMKILHISGFCPEERREKAGEIRDNVLEAITTLARQLEVLDVPLTRPDARDALTYLRALDLAHFSFPQEFFEHTERLWRDPALREVYSQRHKFQLIDCAKYFLDKVTEVRQPDYEPSVQDILHSRRRTTEIQKIEFEVKVPRQYGGGSQNFCMFDVGGQRGERKKWIQVFDGIQAVLFLVSSSCFDLMSREDEGTNRLQDSLDIFRSIWRSRFLKDSGFIVFLNKQDILREKVAAGRRIVDYFPQYQHYTLPEQDRDEAEDQEYLRTRCFIRDQFRRISEEPVRWAPRTVHEALPPLREEVNRKCYFHFTTATDTDNVRRVFDNVHHMIITDILDDIGVTLA